MSDKGTLYNHDEAAFPEKEVVAQSTHQVQNSELAAILETHKPNPWGKGYILLYLVCLLIFLCSTMTGFDGSLMGSINAIRSYTQYYGLPTEGSSSTGLVFAIFSIGQMSSVLFLWTADAFGRTKVIFIGCLGVILATVITSTAPTLSVFIGGRFLLSFFGCLASTPSALYLIEITPPQYRSTLAGMYNTLYYLGSIIATAAVYASHKNLEGDSNLDWRLPLWLQMLCPGIVCLGVLFCPESPRWLVAKDRLDQARAVLVKYHANGEADHPLVELEMTEIIASFQNEKMTSWKSFLDMRVLVKSRSRRYRLMLNIAFSWFGQFSGNNVCSYYLPALLNNVGVTDTDTQLLLNIVYAITGWIPAMIGARLHDVVGRRKMLMISTAGMAISLAITAGTAADYVRTGSKAASSASIAFIYIFGSVFALAFTSMQPIYPNEVISNDARAKGAVVFQFTSGCAGFVNTFAAPVALANIGYWFYVFFVFWDIFEFVIIYFFFVETKGRTLEELDEIFESKNPRKASTALHSVRKRTVVDKAGEKHEEIEAV